MFARSATRNPRPFFLKNFGRKKLENLVRRKLYLSRLRAHEINVNENSPIPNQPRMNENSIIQRLISAKDALTSTIQKILDLNRQLKSLRKSKEVSGDQAIKQELKLLNKVADHQAKIVQLYEYKLKRASN